MDAGLHNGTTLAFIGDAVMGLKVREHLIDKGIFRPAELQRLSSHWVSAKAQALMLDELMKNEFFSEVELNIVKRGRNSNIGTKAKNTDIRTYRASTALEAVWGYLYLNKEFDRLEVLWEAIKTIGDR